MNLHPSLLHIPRVVLCRYRSMQTCSFCGWLVRLPISFHHKPFEPQRCAVTCSTSSCSISLLTPGPNQQLLSTDPPIARKTASTGPSALALSYVSSSAFSLIHDKLLGLALIILHFGPMSLDVLNVWLHILLVDFLEQVPLFLSTWVPLSALGPSSPSHKPPVCPCCRCGWRLVRKSSSAA